MIKKRIQSIEGTGAWFSDGLWLHMDGYSEHRQAQPMHYSTIARPPMATAGKFLCNSGFPSRRDDG